MDNDNFNSVRSDVVELLGSRQLHVHVVISYTHVYNLVQVLNDLRHIF